MYSLEWPRFCITRVEQAMCTSARPDLLLFLRLHLDCLYDHQAMSVCGTVGVAHISPDSIRDAESVVRRVSPAYVVLVRIPVSHTSVSRHDRLSTSHKATVLCERKVVYARPDCTWHGAFTRRLTRRG